MSTRQAPLAWPEFVALCACLSALTALALNAPLVAFAPIQQQFQLAEPAELQWLLSLLILGMALGECVFGPLSDALGRKRSILIGLGLFVAGCLWAASASSYGQLLCARVLQGIGVAGPKIATRALIRDRVSGAAMAQVFSFMMMLLLLVPMLTPALMQVVLQFGPWPWIFALLAALAWASGAWLWWRQAETLAPAQRLPWRWRALGQSYARVLRHGTAMRATAVAGLAFGGSLLLSAQLPVLIDQHYGHGASFAEYFALLSLSLVLATGLNGLLVLRFGMARLLRLACWGYGLTALLFVLSAWLGDVSWPLFLLLCAGLMFCQGLMFGNLNALAMRDLGQVAGVAAAVIASLSSALAFACSALLGLWMTHEPLPLALGCVALGLLSLLVAPWRQAGEDRNRA